MALLSTRRHNLSAILTLLHHDGSQPRSALTAQTGLNRSTVAALVGELAELGLVHETEPDPTNQVGRPSPTVNPDPRNLAIAINPEVDAVTAALVALGGQVVATLRRETEGVPSPDEAVRLSAALVDELVAPLSPRSRVLGIGVAVPGLVRADDGLVRLAPHLEWRDAPIAAMLAEATGYDVAVGNDARLGALVEHIYGAGRGYDEMVYLNGGLAVQGGALFSSWMAHGTGTLAALFVIPLWWKALRRPDRPSEPIPLWAWLGGLAGAVTVIMTSTAVNSALALSGTVALGLAGQIVFGLAADRWGLLGLMRRKLQLGDGIALVLIAAGSVLVIWGSL